MYINLNILTLIITIILEHARFVLPLFLRKLWIISRGGGCWQKIFFFKIFNNDRFNIAINGQVSILGLKIRSSFYCEKGELFLFSARYKQGTTRIANQSEKQKTTLYIFLSISKNPWLWARKISIFILIHKLFFL